MLQWQNAVTAKTTSSAHTTSDRKWPPCAMRTRPTSAPKPAAAAIARLCPRPGGTRKAKATSENPSAAWPDTNAQLRAHCVAGSGAGVKWRGPPMVLEHRIGDQAGPERDRKSDKQQRLAVEPPERPPDQEQP